MTRTLAILSCLILATSSPGSHAQDAEPDCSDQKDQSTMTRCAGLDYEKADADLNRIWPSIKAEAVESDAAEGNGKTDFLDALMSSQRAWIAYRDAECTRQGFEAHNGSMEPMLVNACLAEMTAKRIKDLQGEGLLQ